jgi:hypothetical protein
VLNGCTDVRRRRVGVLRGRFYKLVSAVILRQI